MLCQWSKMKTTSSQCWDYVSIQCLTSDRTAARSNGYPVLRAMLLSREGRKLRAQAPVRPDLAQFVSAMLSNLQ